MIKKFLLLCGVALAAVLPALAAPASADVAVPGVVGKSSGSPVAVINTTQQLVHFECAAVATIVAASTSIDGCHLYANGSYVASSAPISLSGNAAASAAVATTRIGASLKVCYSVSARPVLGGGTVYASGCTLVNTVVAA